LAASHGPWKTYLKAPQESRSNAWLYRLAGAVLSASVLAAGATASASEIWVQVDTSERVLNVMRDDAVVQSFGNISLGVNGPNVAKVLHDKTTPLGSYRVRRINDESRFLLFFGFDYPNLEQAQAGFRAGLISYDQLKSIRHAHYLGQEPPSNTPLGGMIGIHGLGSGDPAIHESFNWTDGCIAVTNEQITELAQWIHLGTRVEVQ